MGYATVNLATLRTLLSSACAPQSRQSTVLFRLRSKWHISTTEYSRLHCRHSCMPHSWGCTAFNGTFQPVPSPPPMLVETSLPPKDFGLQQQYVGRRMMCSSTDNVSDSYAISPLASLLCAWLAMYLCSHSGSKNRNNCSIHAGVLRTITLPTSTHTYASAVCGVRQHDQRPAQAAYHVWSISEETTPAHR